MQRGLILSCECEAFGSSILFGGCNNRFDAMKLDLLVKLGIYGNRTEAIREILHAEADDKIAGFMLNEKVLRALDELLEYERRTGTNPIRIITEKTAAEIVAEGRE